jgi:hypothetical protein
MADSPAREEDRSSLNEEDAKLLKQLHDNPILAARLRQLMNHFEEEVSDGMDAHQAEMMLIEELHQLGGSLMSQWADTTHQQGIAAAKENDPSLIKSGKKNSSGTPPSGQST